MVATLSIAAVATGATNFVAALYSIFEAPRPGAFYWHFRAQLGVAVSLDLREIAFFSGRAT